MKKLLLLCLTSLLLVTGCGKKTDPIVDPASSISIEDVLFYNYWKKTSGDYSTYKNFNHDSVMTLDIESLYIGAEYTNGEVIENMESTEDTVKLETLTYLWDYSTIPSTYDITLIDENTIEVTYNFKNGESIKTDTYESVSFDEIESELKEHIDYFEDYSSDMEFFQKETFSVDEPEDSQTMNISKEEAVDMLINFYNENEIGANEDYFYLDDYVYNGRNGYLVVANDAPFLFLEVMGKVFIDYETGEISEIEPINSQFRQGN